MEVGINTDQLLVLENFFKDLSDIDQRKIFITSYRRATKPLINAMKAGAPRRTSNLIRSIGTIEMPQELSILAGAKKSGMNKGWYGHFVENGTVERFRKTYNGKPLKNGSASTGRVIGTHFAENAFNATESQVNAIVEEEWYNAIDMFIVRTNKKLKAQ
jgi:hypothetical protein